VFLLVHKLVRDFDLQKQSGRIDLFCGARLLVLARLLQIRTVARAIERHLALLTTALRADASMHRRTEPLLFTDFTDNAAQSRLLKSLLHPGAHSLRGPGTRRTGCIVSSLVVKPVN